LGEPAIEQRMRARTADRAQKLAQAVASIRTDQLHFEVVALFDSRRPAFLHDDACFGEGVCRGADRLHGFRSRNSDAIVADEWHPLWLSVRVMRRRNDGLIP